MKILIIIFCLITTYVFAGLLPAPPILRDEPLAEQLYFKSIYDNHNNLEIVTINPDGSRTGRRGDIVLFNDSGTYYIEICVSSPTGTVWVGEELSNTP